MSKWTTDPETLDRRIARALVVAEFGPEGVGVVEYLRRYSRVCAPREVPGNG